MPHFRGADASYLVRSAAGYITDASGFRLSAKPSDRCKPPTRLKTWTAKRTPEAGSCGATLTTLTSSTSHAKRNRVFRKGQPRYQHVRRRLSDETDDLPGVQQLGSVIFAKSIGPVSRVVRDLNRRQHSDGISLRHFGPQAAESRHAFA
jgi:hypothetical protein